MEKQQPKPFVWQMIKEAIEVHGNKSTNMEVKEWVLKHYPGTNTNTILNQIIVCTVNHESRIHYKENQRPRRCCDAIDFLFRPSPGKLELYDTRIHGIWEIAQNKHGVLSVREVKENCESKKDNALVAGGYIDSTHLRHYLAKNLDLIEKDLQLYVDIFGNDGVEYETEFGPIDLLAVDKEGAFVIVEVKIDNYPDASSGQILKYKNWVRRHLAFGKPVRSYLVGPQIPEHVRYSLADCDDVFLKEYDLSIKLKDIPKINDIEEMGNRGSGAETIRASL
ncbi:endonuclease NucS [Chitinispirillales bacterium ANBcel5]|uniref:endonuclease NucS domain-containing protein n=1 Tax=Cellulosispirillum alkaliphilum TaxID=3039283 RepID=UPI002A586005|nr:endonuclease NucS [Chitinispirillales bacterium ANBcel5]